MCDPLTAVTLVGAAASAGMAVQQGMAASEGEQATIDANNNAANQWLAYQQRIRQQEQAKDDANRQQEDAARVATLSKVSPQAQEATQSAEQARLTSLYTNTGGAADTSADPTSALLSGQTGSKDVGALTAKINQATTQARQRIAGLATANSYGGSFGGLGTVIPIDFARGGNAINLFNNMRQGDLKTFGVQQQVQPVQYALGPGVASDAANAKAFGSVAGTLAGIGGTGAIRDLNGAFNVAAPIVPLGQGGVGGDYAASARNGVFV
jgi:hypothetical protein